MLLEPFTVSGVPCVTLRSLLKPKPCEPSDELQESLGPEIPKKSEKKSPGASGPGVPKSLEKVSKKSRTDTFEALSRLFELFRDFFQTFGDPGARGPGRLFFGLFWGFRARRARETPVARRRVRHPSHTASDCEVAGLQLHLSCSRLQGGTVPNGDALVRTVCNRASPI